MKTSKLLFSALILSLSMLTSCSTDDGPDCLPAYTGDLTAEEATLVGEWELSSILADKEIDITDDDVDNPSKDLYAQYSDCFQDAMYTFYQNRNFLFEQGSNAENCTNKASQDGTWKFAVDKLSIVACYEQILEIELNDDKTSFSSTAVQNYRDVNNQTIQATVVFTYSKVIE
ncbi:MAG: DUF5004 domain-containing protein [Leeuwenhoekiella sp.]